MADEVEEETEESTTIISVLAQSNRRDRWTVAPNTSMFTLLARSFFDFRKAETSGKTVEISVVCVFGKVTLVVPEGTDVQLSGISFLASATSDVASSEEPSSLPRLIVTAHTVFGKLCVRTPNDAERAVLAATHQAEELAPVEPSEPHATTPATGTTATETSATGTTGTETTAAEFAAAGTMAADHVVPRQPVGSNA